MLFSLNIPDKNAKNIAFCQISEYLLLGALLLFEIFQAHHFCRHALMHWKRTTPLVLLYLRIPMEIWLEKPHMRLIAFPNQTNTGAGEPKHRTDIAGKALLTELAIVEATG